jgi:hypothetical protein
LFLVGLLTVGLLSSGLLIGYYDSASQSAPLAKDEAGQGSTAVPLFAPVPEQKSVKIKKPVASRSVKDHVASVPLKRSAVANSVARVHQRHSVATRSPRATAERAEAEEISQTSLVVARSPKPEISRSAPSVEIPRSTSYESRAPRPVTVDPRQSSRPQPVLHDKDSGFTAMLKTTWRVLKRPFKF